MSKTDSKKTVLLLEKLIFDWHFVCILHCQTCNKLQWSNIPQISKLK